MNDWKLFCELSLVAMVVMFALWFAIMSKSMNCSEQKDQEPAVKAGDHKSHPKRFLSRS
jgi:hypothetical protein